jgi:hypothetical protein
MNKRQTPSWVGPVAGAVILVGGYVGYQEWKEHDLHSKECARLKRLFNSNFTEMMGPTEDAIREAKRVGNQSPMASLAGDVAANQVVLERLNADCPGWETTNY